MLWRVINIAYVEWQIFSYTLAKFKKWCAIFSEYNRKPGEKDEALPEILENYIRQIATTGETM